MTAADGPGRHRRRGWWTDVAGVGSLVAIVVAYLSPALKDGPAFGTYDFVLQLTGLGKGLAPWPPHNGINSDLVTQMTAWQTYDWEAVHHGHFPLWNDLSLLGLPHFLNFQSSVLGLPNLVSYLAPLDVSFLVAVAVKLLVAGTGAYVLCRVVGLGALPATLAGSTFMCSGAFANWLTWPLSDVLSWAGWIAAAALLAYRWSGRARWVVLLAVCCAFAIYGGFPEGDAILVLGLGALGVLTLGIGAATGRRLSGRGLLRVAGGGLAGLLLAAPLWLPGLQLIHIAHRHNATSFPGAPARALSLLLVPGYYGLPTKGSAFFLGNSNYYETVAYLGAIVGVLAVVAVVRFWRRPLVIALALASLLLLVASYQTSAIHPFQTLAKDLGLGYVEWIRARSLLGLPAGVLAAIGLEACLRAARQRRVRVGYLVGLALAVVATGLLVLLAARSSLPPFERHLQLMSLWWPVGLIVLAAGCGGAMLLTTRRPLQVAGAVALVAGNAGFLVASGVGINSYASVPFATTPAITALQAKVGSSLVAVDTGRPLKAQAFAPVGLEPEVNLAYHLALFSGHDPLLPQEYFAALAPGVGRRGPGLLVPDVTSAAEARRYGAAFILAAPGLAAPAGARPDGTFAGESLYAVAGAARAGFVGGVGVVTAIHHPVASSYVLATRSKSPGRVVLRVTDVPGWHLTIDGRTVSLQRYDGLMLAAEVPAGRHLLHLWYFPGRLRIGIVLALAAALGLAVFAATVWWRRRERPPLRHDDGIWFSGPLDVPAEQAAAEGTCTPPVAGPNVTA